MQRCKVNATSRDRTSYLSFAEHDVGVGRRTLVDVGSVDDEQDVLRLADRDARHAGHRLQTCAVTTRTTR